MSLDVRAGGPELEPTLMDTEPTSAEAAEEQAASLAGKEEGVEFISERPCALPVAAAERFFAVDVLRGFALLGILAMNIVAFRLAGRGLRQPAPRRRVRGARPRRSGSSTIWSSKAR